MHASRADPPKMQWLTTPDKSLNYQFIAAIYCIFIVAGVLLFAVEHYGVSEQVSGWWMIPAPALPALLWALFMHSRQLSFAKASKEA